MKKTSATKTAEDGVAAPLAKPPVRGEQRTVKLDSCCPSAGFNREDLQLDAEFLKSIRERGVLVPAVVRTLRDVKRFVVCECTKHGATKEHGWECIDMASKVRAEGVPQRYTFHATKAEAEKAMPKYEIIAGHRRFAAAEQEKLTEWPVIVVEVDDKGLRELRLVENLQRTDLSAIDEARQYQEALASGDYGTGKEAVAKLAARVGKGLTAVYEKLQLLKASAPVLKEVATGRLDWSTAILLSRILDSKLQAKALTVVMCGDEYERRGGEDEPMSYREAADFIRRRFQRGLKLAKFDPEDATLTKAGVCSACPYRAGNILGNTGSPDLCTNVGCFEEKEKTTVDRKIQAAKAKGQRIVEGKAFDQMRYSGGYVSPGSQCHEDSKFRTWSTLLGKTRPESTMLGIDRKNGEVIEFIPKAAAMKVLKEKGVKLQSRSEPSAWEKKHRAEREKTKGKVKILQRVQVRAMEVIQKKALNEPSLGFWRMLATLAAHAAPWDMQTEFVKSRNLAAKPGMNSDKLVLKFVEGLKTEEALRVVAIELLLHDALNEYNGNFDDGFKTAADWAGVDLKKLEQEEAKAKPAKTEKLKAETSKAKKGGKRGK